MDDELEAAFLELEAEVDKVCGALERLKTRNPAWKVVSLVSPSECRIKNEILNYDRVRASLLQHKKNNSYSVLLAGGAGAHFQVMPIKKDGSRLKAPVHWSHSSKWKFVGAVHLFTAYRKNKIPESSLGKWCFKMFSDEAEPVYQWCGYVAISKRFR